MTFNEKIDTIYTKVNELGTLASKMLALAREWQRLSSLAQDNIITVTEEQKEVAVTEYRALKTSMEAVISDMP